MKIVYLCHLSNDLVRSHLDLVNYQRRSKLLSFFKGNSSHSYNDFAIWNADMATEFAKLKEHEFHIVSPHIGMKNDISHFTDKGVYYHFYKCNGSLLADLFYSKFHIDRKLQYRRFRSKIKNIINGIHPDIVVVCGAEQPYFSSGIFDINSCPVYVLLQTVVNNPQLKGYLKGAEEMGAMEESVFKRIQYVGTCQKYLKLFRQYNKKAYCLPFSFPSHQPPIAANVDRVFDFVFFASVITKNKGVEDVIKAYNQVYVKNQSASLNICGRIDEDYKRILEDMVEPTASQNGKIQFTGYFSDINEKYIHVQKSKIAVLPSISAALNSTVRESMLMALPTIVYETPAFKKMNSNAQTVLTAKMEDIHDLANKMEYLLLNPDISKQIALEGKKFADKTWDNSVVVNKLIVNINAIVANYYKDEPISNELLLEIES